MTAEKDLPSLVVELLVMEHGKLKEEAELLCSAFPNVMVNGIMSGVSLINVRATAMALLMAENDAKKGE